LEYGEPLLHLSRSLGDTEQELNALNHLAVFYSVVKSDYKTSMQYLLEALEKGKEIKFRKIIAQCLINIGTIHAHLLNYHDAHKRYEQAVATYIDVIPNTNLVILYNNIGKVHFELGEYGLALSYFKKAYDLAVEIKYQVMVAHSLAQISRSQTALAQLDIAFDNAIRAQELMKDLGDINGRNINLLNLGHIYFRRGDHPEAIKLISRGITASKQNDDKAQEIRGYQLLALLYQKEGAFEKALQYSMIYAEAQKKFSLEQMHNQVIDLEIKHAIQDKQREIEQLTKENEFQALLLEQSDQIAKQNVQLLQANEELRQFAYVASHDLKEPLRMIGSYVQLIHRLHGKDFNKDSNQYFLFVKEGVERMNHLLDALLQYATIGKSAEDMELVNLQDVVDIAIINLRVRIEETQAEISCGELPSLYSIQSLLVQLFQNLLSNAIKFRQPDLLPQISIQSEETEDEYIIKVKDNGIGIAPGYKERIFIIFQRLHTRDKYEGTGIGLAICQKIVQRLNGRIWVESEVGQGATFLLGLPKQQSPEHLA